MRTIRSYLVALCVLIGAAGSAQAWVSINIDLFPELVPVPGYPVYYAPRMNSNYFFYDGMYWLYEDDEWYVSDWYNGPWDYVDPEFVPVYVLRIPVRYYRRPPPYFREWRPDAPPRWGYHWGGEWEHRHSGWDHWDRKRAPALAPLPVYQRHYSGERYPRPDEQREIRTQNYRYQPRDSKVREHYQQPIEHANEPAQRENRSEHQQRSQPENDVRHMPSSQDNRERSAPPQQQSQQRQQQQQPQRDDHENRNSGRERVPYQQQAPAVREQQSPAQHQEREINSPRNVPAAAPGHGREQDKSRDDNRGQGEGHDKDR